MNEERAEYILEGGGEDAATRRGKREEAGPNRADANRQSTGSAPAAPDIERINMLTVYIATSWKNQHAAEMLTAMLRDIGCEVLSFIENQHGEKPGATLLSPDGIEIPFDEWVWTKRAGASFAFDTRWAQHADVVIYISPAGTDAWAEVGMAYATDVPIFGLYAKGEQSGLMRRMVAWLPGHAALIDCFNASGSNVTALSKLYDEIRQERLKE